MRRTVSSHLERLIVLDLKSREKMLTKNMLSFSKRKSFPEAGELAIRLDECKIALGYATARLELETRNRPRKKRKKR